VIRFNGRVIREILAFVLVLLAILSVIAIIAPDAGEFIRPWHDFLSHLLGWGIFFSPAILAGFAVLLWMKSVPSERAITAWGVAVIVIALLGMFHLAVGGGEEAVASGDGGGVIGLWVSSFLTRFLGDAGAWIALLLLFIAGILLYFNMSAGDLFATWSYRREQEAARGANGRQPTTRTNRAVDESPGRQDRAEPPLIIRRQRPETNGRSTPVHVDPDGGLTDALPVMGAAATVGVVANLDEEEDAFLTEVGVAEANDAALEPADGNWQLPDLALLADGPGGGVGQLDLTAKGDRITETLASFGIGVNVARIQEGPVVTQYALEVDPGIKLSRIQGLADNIALALAARSVRIEAPIAGEPYVGVEIPNAAFDMVTLKEVLASQTFEQAAARSKLAFGLGQDVAGQPFPADLGRMPHVLIAGATGSGKSVCVNAILCSLLMRATPSEVKLLMIDPKRVEMANYRGIPHLLTEVIVDADKAVNALKWTVTTMEARYHQFAERGVRNIAGFNERVGPSEDRMPYIVIVIDELADLMMVSAYEVEATITRIAQLARATGIHLVVATQRPSVQVITGLIKANIPSRIAFAMTSGVDSRTILDTTGAEDLLGRGDMLYQPIDAPRAVRLQGVLVTDEEIEKLARFWRAQGSPHYRPEITASRRDSRTSGAEEEGDGDPLLSQAIDIVRRSEKASASLLQRRLRVGYARAARMLDQMEDRGIVGPQDGSKFREVLVTSDGWGGDVGPDGDDE
jgi:S-DNA-T family DNA segregation ATPase FtsK/SpoIIIE